MSTPASPVLPSPFSDQPANLKWIPSPELDRRLAKLRKRFSGMGVAVVDLTYSSPNPKFTGWLAFSGWNVKRQFNTDSMTKICAMYAAYQLRWSLTRAAATLKVATPKAVIDEVTHAWAPIIAAGVPEADANDFPKLNDMFEITGSPGAWTADFKRGFHEHIKYMIEHSGNAAAANVINGVGYSYLNGALAAKGLYDRNAGGGLWLAWNYGGRKWKPDPVGKTWTGANAEAAAKFIVLLETERMVSKWSDHDMREKMENSGSWFVNGLFSARPPRHRSRSFHKIGVYAGPLHECALIERFVDGVDIRYAVVCLNAASTDALDVLIRGIDDAILESPTVGYE